MPRRRSQLNIRCADGDLARIDAAADRAGLSRADYLRKVIADDLKRNDEPDHPLRSLKED